MSDIKIKIEIIDTFLGGVNRIKKLDSLKVEPGSIFTIIEEDDLYEKDLYTLFSKYKFSKTDVAYRLINKIKYQNYQNLTEADIIKILDNINDYISDISANDIYDVFSNFISRIQYNKVIDATNLLSKYILDNKNLEDGEIVLSGYKEDEFLDTVNKILKEGSSDTILLVEKFINKHSIKYNNYSLVLENNKVSNEFKKEFFEKHFSVKSLKSFSENINNKYRWLVVDCFFDNVKKTVKDEVKRTEQLVKILRFLVCGSKLSLPELNFEAFLKNNMDYLTNPRFLDLLYERLPSSSPDWYHIRDNYSRFLSIIVKNITIDKAMNVFINMRQRNCIRNASDVIHDRIFHNLQLGKFKEYAPYVSQFYFDGDNPLNPGNPWNGFDFALMLKTKEEKCLSSFKKYVEENDDYDMILCNLFDEHQTNSYNQRSLFNCTRQYERNVLTYREILEIIFSVDRIYKKFREVSKNMEGYKSISKSLRSSFTNDIINLTTNDYNVSVFTASKVNKRVEAINDFILYCTSSDNETLINNVKEFFILEPMNEFDVDLVNENLTNIVMRFTSVYRNSKDLQKILKDATDNIYAGINSYLRKCSEFYDKLGDFNPALSYMDTIQDFYESIKLLNEIY